MLASEIIDILCWGSERRGRGGGGREGGAGLLAAAPAAASAVAAAVAIGVRGHTNGDSTDNLSQSSGLRASKPDSGLVLFSQRN